MERQLKKLKEDSYAVRKEEGRPKHGQQSFWIMGIGAASWFFFAVAIAVPSWRANYLGMLGYPHPRTWGLFAIVGLETVTYHDYMGTMCRYYSQMAPGGLCMTPICLWYRTKCVVSMNMCAACYAAAFFFVLILVLHSLCLVWTMRLTPRLIRWAATWWCGQVILHIAVLMFYIFMTADCFASLDNESMYPEPNFTVCFYIECLVIMCVCTNAVLGIKLMSDWPESSSDSSDDDDEDDSEDSDGNPRQPQGGPPPGGPPPGYQGGPPQGYQGGPPPPGYQGGPPQQGYQGGPPQQGYGGQPPPGYGPPQGQWQG